MTQKSCCRNQLLRKNLIVQQEGNRQVKREQTFYSLDAIISVGYRVNSKRATLFRQWATRILNEFIRKRFEARRYIQSHTAD